MSLTPANAVASASSIPGTASVIDAALLSASSQSPFQYNIQVRVPMSTVYPSGIQYVAVKDSTTGTLTYTASSASSSLSVIRSSLSTSSLVTSQSGLVDGSFSFLSSDSVAYAVRSLKLSPYQLASGQDASGTGAEFGRLVLSLASNYIFLEPRSDLTKSFADVSSYSATLSSTASTQIQTILSSRATLQLIVDDVIQRNGPVLVTSGGPSVFQASLLNSSQVQLALLLHAKIDYISLGLARSIVIAVPVCIVLQPSDDFGLGVPMHHLTAQSLTSWTRGTSPVPTWSWPNKGRTAPSMFSISASGPPLSVVPTVVGSVTQESVKLDGVSLSVPSFSWASSKGFCVACAFSTKSMSSTGLSQDGVLWSFATSVSGSGVIRLTVPSGSTSYSTSLNLTVRDASGVVSVNTSLDGAIQPDNPHSIVIMNVVPSVTPSGYYVCVYASRGTALCEPIFVPFGVFFDRTSSWNQIGSTGLVISLGEFVLLDSPLTASSVQALASRLSDSWSYPPVHTSTLSAGTLLPDLFPDPSPVLPTLTLPALAMSSNGPLLGLDGVSDVSPYVSYLASDSSSSSGAYLAFSQSSLQSWTSTSSYVSGTGVYVGPCVTPYLPSGPTGVLVGLSGEWLQLEVSHYSTPLSLALSAGPTGCGAWTLVCSPSSFRETSQSAVFPNLDLRSPWVFAASGSALLPGTSVTTPVFLDTSFLVFRLVFTGSTASSSRVSVDDLTFSCSVGSVGQSLQAQWMLTFPRALPAPLCSFVASSGGTSLALLRPLTSSSVSELRTGLTHFLQSSSTSLSSSGLSSSLAIKYDSSGTQLWSVAASGALPLAALAHPSHGSTALVLSIPSTSSSPTAILSLSPSFVISLPSASSFPNRTLALLGLSASGSAAWVVSASAALPVVPPTVTSPLLPTSTDPVLISRVQTSGSTGRLFLAGTYGPSSAALYNPDGTLSAFSLRATSSGTAAFLACFDASSSPLWACSIDGSGVESGAGVSVDPLGRVVLAGTSVGATAPVIYSAGNAASSLVVPVQSSVSTSNSFLVQFDVSGVARWAASSACSDQATTRCSDVTCDKSGNVLVLGTYGSPWPSSSYSYNPTDANGNIFATLSPSTNRTGSFVMKFDSDGSGILATSLVLSDSLSSGNGVNADSVSIRTDSSGNFFVCGTSVTGLAIPPLLVQPSQSTSLAFLAKFDCGAVPQWVARVDAATSSPSSYFRAEGLDIDPWGNAFLAGTYSAATGGVVTSTLSASTLPIRNTSAAATAGLVVKFDPSGTPSWVSTVAGSGNQRAIALASDSQGGVFLTGMGKASPLVYGSGASDPGQVGRALTSVFGTTAAFVVKLDAAGGVAWTGAIDVDASANQIVPSHLATQTTGRVTLVGQISASGNAVVKVEGVGLVVQRLVAQAAFVTTLQDIDRISHLSSGSAAAAQDGTWRLALRTTPSSVVSLSGTATVASSASGSSGYAIASCNTVGGIDWVGKLEGVVGSIATRTRSGSPTDTLVVGQYASAISISHPGLGAGAAAFVQLATPASQEGLITRLSTSGVVSVVWRLYSASAAVALTQAVATKDGGYLIAGNKWCSSSLSSSGGITPVTWMSPSGTVQSFPVITPPLGVSQTASGFSFVTKVDASGIPLWSSSFDTDTSMIISETADTGFIALSSKRGLVRFHDADGFLRYAAPIGPAGNCDGSIAATLCMDTLIVARSSDEATSLLSGGARFFSDLKGPGATFACFLPDTVQKQ